MNPFVLQQFVANLEQDAQVKKWVEGLVVGTEDSGLPDLVADDHTTYRHQCMAPPIDLFAY